MPKFNFLNKKSCPSYEKSTSEIINYKVLDNNSVVLIDCDLMSQEQNLEHEYSID